MATNAFTVRHSANSAAIGDTTFSKTSDSLVIVDTSVAASQTHKDMNFPGVQYAKIVSLYLCFSTACTLKTNSTGSPDQTLVFVANVPLIWTSDMPTACPITANITEIFLTNGAAATTVKMVFGVIV